MILHLLLSILSSILTYTFIQRGMKAARSSALVTLFLCFILKGILKENATLAYQVVFAASFIGMASPKKFNAYQVLLASAILPSILFGLNTLKLGAGGTLGLSAFLSCCVIFAIYRK